MKKILVVTFLIVSSIGYAQSVSLDDLISYQQSSISEINAKLIAKSWTLVKSHHDENMKDEYISGDVWTISDCIWEYDGGDIHSEIDYTYTMSLSKNNNAIFNRIKTVNYLTTSRENYLIGIGA